MSDIRFLNKASERRYVLQQVKKEGYWIGCLKWTMDLSFRIQAPDFRRSYLGMK